MKKPGSQAFGVVGKYKTESIFSSSAASDMAKQQYQAKIADMKVINRDLEVDGGQSPSIEIEREEIREGEVIICEEMVSRNAKKKELHTIEELMLASEGITFLNKNNQILRAMSAALTSLDLRYNKISQIQNLEMMRNLEILCLNYNKIKKIENLNLPNLKELRLDGNQIESIQNLGKLKNLQILSLEKNQLTKVSLAVDVEPYQLMELRELNLAKN